MCKGDIRELRDMCKEWGEKEERISVEKCHITNILYIN